MAYTTPFTAVAGTAWKASDWNTYGRDNIAWIATDSPSCRVYNNAALSIPDGVSTDATFNSERYDNAAMHSTSSLTNRITVPTGGTGKYLVGGTGYWAANASGTTRELWVELNGTSTIAPQNTPFNATVTPGISITTVYALSAADYVTLQVYQDRGGTLNLFGNPGPGPEFYALWYRT